MKRVELFKQKRICIVLFLAVLLSIFCIIKIAMPNKEYLYSGERVFDDGVVQLEAVLYEQVELPPGVYEIQLSYQTDTDMQNVCTLKDGSVFTGGLLTNGENLYKGLNKTSFKAWLFESTETLRVELLYGGVGYAVTGDLTIYETNDLWTMLLTIIWSVAFLVIGLLGVRDYDRTVGVEKEKKTVLFGLGVIILIASTPYLYGSCMAAGDLGYHLMRIEGVKDGILSGQFPLRIEPEWLHGYGYANSIFYCNTFLYFPAVLRLLGFNISVSYSLFCIAMNIATACIAYYCFMKIFKDRYIGLMCSALYTLSIYRIYKLVICGAVGEGSAVTFMPLILYGLYRVFAEDVNEKAYKTAWIPIAAGYAGLIQSHVLSCEIAAFLTIGICLVHIKKVFVKQTFWELFKGAVSAFLMSFWYLVPFLDYYASEDMHIRHVSARTIQDRGLYFPQLFFNWWKNGGNAMLGDEGMMDAHPMGVGLVLGIGFILFCIFWFGGQWRKEKARIITLGKIACIISGILMLMSLNIFPWDRIQNINSVSASLVSSIQFPNRFLGWGTVFLVTICGCLFWYFEKKGKKWEYYLGVVCVLLGITTSGMYLLDYMNRDAELVYIYNEEGMGFGYISGKEYIIEGTDSEVLLYDEPASSENVEIISYDKEYLHMWIKCVNTDGEGYIELPLLHYKGYKAYVTSTGEELVTEKGTNNVVRVLVPEDFAGEIEVKFVSPIYWRISEVITYAWWFFVAISVIYKTCKVQKEKRDKLCVTL